MVVSPWAHGVALQQQWARVPFPRLFLKPRGGSASPSRTGPPTVQATTGGALPSCRPRGRRTGPQGLTPPGPAPHSLALGVGVNSVGTPMPCAAPRCPSQRGGLFMSGAGSVVPSSWPASSSWSCVSTNGYVARHVTCHGVNLLSHFFNSLCSLGVSGTFW